MNKRGLSILLVLCMLFSLMPALNMNANAAGGVLAKMDQAESVWPNGSHYVESANAGGAKTCYGFARELFLYVFGRTLPGFFGVNDPAAMFCDASGNPVYTNVVLIGHYERSSYTVDALKSLIAQSKPGDILIGSNGSTNHIMMIHSVDGNIGAVTVYDANYDGHNTIYTHRYFTAQQFRNWKTLAVSLYRASNYDEIDGVPNPVPPAAPSVSVNGTNVTVTWNDVANETGYDAYLIQEPWGWNDVKYSVHAGPDYCHYTFTNVTPGTYAAFVVSRPNSDQTQSGWTVFEVPALPAAPTVNVSPVSLYEGQSMTVSWNTVPGATSYYVRVYDPSTEVDFYGNNVGTATSQTLTFDPGKAGTYSVVVCSVNSAGGYTPSSPITVTVREGNILAQGSCGERVTWVLDKNGTLTISGTGAMYNYAWSSSGSSTAPWKDYIRNIKSVVIQSGVTSIGDFAFDNCSNLASVTIPVSVTSIGEYAFSDCSSLASVTIPASATSIGLGAFSGCSSLTSVTIPEGVTSIRDDTFSNCSSLTNVIIPANVTNIGGAAFKNCSGLTSVTIPESVTSIGWNVFEGCSSLRDIYYSGTEAQKAAISIGNYNDPLLNANWNYIGTCGDNVTWRFSNGVLTISGTGEMNSSRWRRDFTTQIQTVVIEPGVTNIDSNAFDSCTNLTSVAIPPTVTSIEQEAFSGCSSLTSVTIPSSVTNIELAAFFGCRSLTSVTIPASVTSIANSAFYMCTSLTSVTIPEGVTSIGASAFYYCNSLTSVTIPSSVTSIKRNAFNGCSSLKSVTIPEGVTSIENSAFYGCSSLASVTIPESVASIEGFAFAYCNSLTSVLIPASVTSIGYNAFGSCSSLTSIKVDEGNPVYTSVKGVLYDKGITELVAFPGGLTSVTIPVGVTSIGAGAFYYCNSLTSMTIPSSVTSIGNSAFINCSKLKDVHFCGTETQRAAMAIGDSNDPLLNATWTYGHIWDAGVVMQEPTVTTDGVKKYTCTACGETKTEAIPMLGNPFTDVAAGKFYYAPVLWAISQDPQITTGVTKTTFAPDRICTRAHVVTFLWRANGCPEPKLTANPFKDVPNGKYYYKAVLWAAENGITTGYADNTFRPDDECSRGQVVTFLWRAKGQPKPTSTANPFADVASGQYYTTAVLWALETGVTTGRTATLFGTADACTRGHVVTFLYRAYAD